MSVGGGHPAPEELDLLLDDPGSAARDPRVVEHVEGCEQCRATLSGMAEVRSLLRAEAARVPLPPADLDARISAALATAGDGRSLPSGAPDGTVVPLRRPGPRVPRWAAVAAGLVVLAGAALTATQLVGQDRPVTSLAERAGGEDSSADGGAAEAAPAAPVVATGTDYAPDRLPAQVADLLEMAPQAGSLPLTATEARGDAAPSGEPLATPEGLAGCLQALGSPGAVPEAVDLATWQGREVAVIVLDTGDATAVWVVQRTCAPGADGLVHYQSLRR